MKQSTYKIHAVEINPSMVGALFTDRNGDQVRLCVYYANGDTVQFEVPEHENRESLQNLFSKLDMASGCTSVILEKVVRGRVYGERDGKLQLYTLLATAGDELPAIQANICDLPWQVVWASTEAEVLRLTDPKRDWDCYAIRSLVSPVDAEKLYRSAHAFVKPLTMPAQKQSFSLAASHLVTAALLLVAVGLGWFLGHQSNKDMPVQAAELPVRQSAVPVVEAPKASPDLQVQMLSDRKITGPFTLAEVQSMKSEGKLPADAVFRTQGATEWVSLGDVFENPANRGGK
jgi:hypothetical protein